LEKANLLEARFRTEKITCVHGVSNAMTALPAAIAAKRLGLPFIYEVRGFWELSRAANDPDYNASIGFYSSVFLETQTAKMADRVIALSEPIRNELIARGVPAQIIFISRNGAALNTQQTSKPSPFETSRAKLTIGFVGSLTPYEGLATLIDTVKKLSVEPSVLQVLIFGDGPSEDSLKTKIKSAGLTSQIQMMGRINHADVPSAYALMDVVYSGRDDSTVSQIVSPMKPLEALAHGKPLIASDLRALTDLLAQGAHVEYFEAQNVTDLSICLRSILDWKVDDMNRRKAAASAWVNENRTWADSAEPILQAYDTLS